MFNPPPLNAIGVHQLFLQQVQQQLPSMLPPVEDTHAATASRDVKDQPLDRSASEQVDLHSLIDYTPWLKRLYGEWREALRNHFGEHNHPTPPAGMHWQPETTARLLTDLGLAYGGWLWRVEQRPPEEVIESLTFLWRQTWQEFSQMLINTHAQPGVTQAMGHCASFFNQFWLEAWLHLAEMQEAASTE